MVFDREALRQQILLAYPEAMLFFETAVGQSMGLVAPEKIDLLVDFTGPGQRQGFFHAKKLKSRSRVAVGRMSGYFRKRVYDRLFNELGTENGLSSEVPQELLERERFVQKKVLALAGIGFIQAGQTPADRSHSIALELPGMKGFSS
jgi:hypothetical protein